MLSRVFLFGICVACIAITADSVRAGGTTLTMVSAESAATDHWPGADGNVDTSDDVINSNLSPIHMSAPNPGSYCFNAFDFTGDDTTDSGMPTGFNAITFITGSVDVDLSVASAEDAQLTPIVTGLTVDTGTEPFPGHGAYTAMFTNISGGAYNPADGEFSLVFDFTATISGNTDTSLNSSVTGTAHYAAAADFGTATGIAYMDDVVIPIAQAANAVHVLYLTATGTAAAAEGGSWGEMGIAVTVIALVDKASPIDEMSWTSIKNTF